MKKMSIAVFYSHGPVRETPRHKKTSCNRTALGSTRKKKNHDWSMRTSKFHGHRAAKQENARVVQERVRRNSPECKAALRPLPVWGISSFRRIHPSTCPFT